MHHSSLSIGQNIMEEAAVCSQERSAKYNILSLAYFLDQSILSSTGMQAHTTVCI